MRRFSDLFASSVLSLLLTQVAVAAKPAFLDVGGVYRGSAKVSVSGAPASFSGPVTIVVKAPASGRTASLKVSGSLAIGGQTVPLTGVVAFKAGSKFTVSDLTFNLETKSVPLKGSFHGRPVVNFRAPFSAGSTNGTITGSARFRTTKTRKFLTFHYFLFAKSSSIALDYTFNVAKKRKN